jgi:hypothetical protein
VTNKPHAAGRLDGRAQKGADVLARPTRHQIEWAASGLRRAAADAGIVLPVNYSQAVAADGLAREPELGVTRLGTGVVIHTNAGGDKRPPIVLGYADGRGQWYRDGRRHTEPAVETSEQPAQGIPL